MDLRSTRSIPDKSLWRETSGGFTRFFCPHCKGERKVAMGTRPDSPMRYFQVALATAVGMLATWSWFGWKGFVLYVPLWVAFEVYYRLRLRALMPCPRCGFDPYLYMTDVERARKAIEQHWRKKFEERGIPFPEPAPAGAKPEPNREKIEPLAPKRPPRAINAKQHLPLNPE